MLSLLVLWPICKQYCSDGSKSICHAKVFSYASDFDVLFNVSMSNCIVVTSRDKRNLALQINNCSFSLGGNAVCRVDSYVHLGHIIDCRLNDMMLCLDVIVSLDSPTLYYVISINSIFLL